MRAMGQEDAVARGAARYLLLAMPALLCTGMFECLKRYLMAQVSVWEGSALARPRAGAAGFAGGKQPTTFVDSCRC